MANRDIVVIGGSAGATTALQRLIGNLPGDFPAAIFIVVHISPDSPGMLPQIFANAGQLPAADGRHGEAIELGRIYVAPPDRHLLIKAPGLVQIGYGPKENRFRPAVDPLFRSAAYALGPRVIGIVLSGGLDDGTIGLQAIKQAGGLTIVQNPDDAEVPSMPASALRHVAVDHRADIDDMAELLVKLAGEPIKQKAAAAEPAMPMELEVEVQVQADEHRRETAIRELGEPSLFTCPDCHGALIEIKDSLPRRFRCHTGHAYTSASLEAELGEKIENALWNTIRALEEHAMLLNHMAKHNHDSSSEPTRLSASAQDALRRAGLIRDALASNANEAAE